MGVIRGAICAQNTAEDISARAEELVREILRRNSLCERDVQAILFTATADLNACYPAQSVRQFLGGNIAYICAQEMNVVGSLDHCLRVCVFAQKLSQDECKHCYLGKAAILHPDLQ